MELFQQSGKVDYSIAYLSYSGWALVRPILDQWFKANGKKLRLLVGQNSQFPDMRAIRELNGFPGVEIAFVPLRNFHAKQWLFYGDSKVKVLTGSANFTKNGLFNNAEASVVNELDYDHPEISILMKNFENWWGYGSYLAKENEDGMLQVPDIAPAKLDLVSEDIVFTPGSFEEVTATIRINGRLYFCFLRQSIGTGIENLKQSLQKTMGEIWGLENPIMNYREKIGENEKKYQLGSFESPSIISNQTSGKLSNGERFRIYSSGTHMEIIRLLPEIFKASGIEENWNIKLRQKSGWTRGDKKKYFASPSIQLTYLNKIPHTYFGAGSKIAAMTQEDMYNFALSFHKNAIEFPDKIFIDSVYKITNGGGTDIDRSNCSPMMLNISFTQRIDHRNWEGFARIAIPRDTGTAIPEGISKILDIFAKHCSDLLSRGTVRGWSNPQ